MGKLGGYKEDYQAAGARLRVPAQLCGSFQVGEDDRTEVSAAAQLIKEINQSTEKKEKKKGKPLGWKR